MNDVVLFGAGRIAEVAHYYMTREGDFRVVGFCCDREYQKEESAHGVPLVAFEEVESHFPPDRVSMFVALGYQDLNRVRAERIRQARDKGYHLASYVHPSANVWQGLPEGENRFILDGVSVEFGASLGDGVFVWSNAVVGHHSDIGNDTWIVANATIAGSVTLGEQCFVGANATIGNEVVIGERCFIGANALVTKDLPDRAVAVAASSEPMRVDSDQFLRIARFR